MLKRCSNELGYDQSLYASHSFRSGGTASIETKLRKSPSRERPLKLHGRWNPIQPRTCMLKNRFKRDLMLPKSLEFRIYFKSLDLKLQNRSLIFVIYEFDRFLE